MVRLKACDMQADLDAVFGDVEVAEQPLRQRRREFDPVPAGGMRYDPGRVSRDPTPDSRIRAWRASDLPLTPKERSEQSR